MTSADDQRSFFLQHYRGMDTEDLVELRAGELTAVAREAIDVVLAERGISQVHQQQLLVRLRQEEPSKPYGIAGWLLWLVVWMIFVRPLLGAGSIYAEMRDVELELLSRGAVVPPEWASYKIATWCTFAASAGVSAYGGFALARQRTWAAVIVAKLALWISAPIATLVQLVVVPFSVFGNLNAVDSARVVGSFFGAVVVALIWTAYLSRSKRVRNTYPAPQ